MKKFLILLLALMLLLPCAAHAQEPILYNKTKGENYTFAPDAQLLEIYFPKIYGCDAALVRYGDYSMLIDCAGNQHAMVSEMLTDLGVTELTYALNSHPDADHIGGFDSVLSEVPAGEFLLGFPEDHDSGDEVRFKVYNALHEMNIPLRRVSDGDSIEFGDVKITVHQRTDEHLPRVNNKSVMLMLEYGERRFFFTGDIQRATQMLLIDEAETLDLKADIMKFPHHGYSNMQPGFLKMVSPELVICTCGQGDTDGIKQLKDEKISYLLTARNVIRLATDGKVWTVERLE